MKDNPKGFWGYIRQRTKARVGISDLKDDQSTESTDVLIVSHDQFTVLVVS